ncbi:GTPase activating protein (GAP) for Rho1p [Microbotryomycetes sp. JL221]|nr:GTPase activating protein (GAP) for Rho1p [Microbotryomycetes sp. JL221]
MSAAQTRSRAAIRPSFDSQDPIERAEAVRYRAEQERLERERLERKAVKRSLIKWWKAFTRKHGWSRPSHTSSTLNHGSSSTRNSVVATRSMVAPPSSSTGGTNHQFKVTGRGLQHGQSGKDKVFGVSPQQSLKYASVAISLVASDGKPYVYGYVPIVVAKCGMWLKENATHTQGIFRVSGSNKRINQLQSLFDTPPAYGKDLDWTGYSVHDAASVLRRYLNQMPEPVIPADLYLDFTAVLRKFLKYPRNLAEKESVKEYQKLIGLLPAPSRYLLLYLLDFLSVFVRHSEHNLMTASNLATVFQPGLVSTRREGAGKDGALLGFPGFGADGNIVDSRRGSQPAWIHSHPPGGTTTKGNQAGEQAREGAGEHGKGKEVLEFLIEQQSHFMLGLQPPIKEAKSKKHVTSTTTSTASPKLMTKPIATSTKMSSETSRDGSGHKDAAEDSGYGQSSPSESGGLSTLVSRTTEGTTPSVLDALPPATRLANTSIIPDTSGPGPLAAELAAGATKSLNATTSGIGSSTMTTSSTNLMRKGSEKSVERRRLRKNQEEASKSGATVKRSKTVPSQRSSRSSTPAVDVPTPPPGLADSPRGSPNPNATGGSTTLKATRSLRKQRASGKADLPTVPASPDRPNVSIDSKSKKPSRASAVRDDSVGTMHTARTSASTGLNRSSSNASKTRPKNSGIETGDNVEGSPKLAKWVKPKDEEA